MEGIRALVYIEIVVVLGFKMVSSGSLGLRVVQVVQRCQFQGFSGLGGRSINDIVCRRVCRVRFLS